MPLFTLNVACCKPLHKSLDILPFGMINHYLNGLCIGSALVKSHSCLIHYWWNHYDDVIMSTIASQITSLTIVYSTIYSGADQSKHQSSASLAFVWGIHRGPVNSPHKWPVTRKMFPFDDVIMHIQIPIYDTCTYCAIPLGKIGIR